MAVSLVDVTKDNFETCIRLRVRDDQQSFVAPNLYSIAQSQFYPDVHINAIVADDQLVGLVMWGIDVDDNPGEMWVWRLMVDRQHQGRGYGHAAMQEVIRQVRAAGHDALYLSYVPDNALAARFYARLGFESTGRVEHGETVVRKDLSPGDAATGPP